MLEGEGGNIGTQAAYVDLQQPVAAVAVHLTGLGIDVQDRTGLRSVHEQGVFCGLEHVAVALVGAAPGLVCVAPFELDRGPHRKDPEHAYGECPVPQGLAVDHRHQAGRYPVGVEQRNRGIAHPADLLDMGIRKEVLDSVIVGVYSSTPFR
jgi:hypothetical protein